MDNGPPLIKVEVDNNSSDDVDMKEPDDVEGKIHL